MITENNALIKTAKINNLDDGLYVVAHIFINLKRVIAIKDGFVISRGHSFRQSFFFEVNKIYLKIS